MIRDQLFYSYSLFCVERFLTISPLSRLLQILCWDAKSFFVEQKIIRNSDGFVCAIVLARQAITDHSPKDVSVMG